MSWRCDNYFAAQTTHHPRANGSRQDLGGWDLFGYTLRMVNKQSFWKRFITDLSGWLLIFGSLAFGWLPGPGGIPLLLAGLGLLSINHRWAKRLIKIIKEQGIHFWERFFDVHPLLKAVYDLASVGLVVGAILILNTVTKNSLKSLGIVMFFTGLTLFLGNRQRLKNFTIWFKKKLKRT